MEGRSGSRHACSSVVRSLAASGGRWTRSKEEPAWGTGRKKKPRMGWMVKCTPFSASQSLTVTVGGLLKELGKALHTPPHAVLYKVLLVE